LKLKLAGALLALLVALGSPVVAQTCGDGTLDPDTEACDDGNNVSGDGCDGDCYVRSYVAVGGSDTSGDGSESKPYRTIQKAFQAAKDFTRIVVGPGTYNECVRASAPVALDRPVHILAAAWENAQDNTQTTITGAGICDAAQPVNNRAATVRLASRSSAIEGFTITGGGASGINAAGSVVITGNIITDNDSTLGGGVYFYSAARYFPGDIETAIAGNTIEGNRAAFGVPPLGDPGSPVGGDGGGLFVRAVSTEGNLPTAGVVTVSIDGNEIRGNTIEEDSDSTLVKVHGGGLGVFTNSSAAGVVEVAITNNLIAENSVVEGSLGYSGGGWLYTYGYGTESFRVEGNTVENNSAELDGGGLSTWINTLGTREDGNPSTDDSNIHHSFTIEDNVVRNNSSNGSGGGLDMFVFTRDLRGTERARIVARGNEITGNTAGGGDNGGGGGVLATFVSWRSATADSKILFEDNFVTGNTAAVSGGGMAFWVEADADPPNDASGRAPSYAAADVESRRNLVAGNDASSVGALGGGAFAFLQSFVDGRAALTVDQSTIADNLADLWGGGLHVETYTGFDDPPSMEAEARLIVRNSILSDNDGVGIGGPEPGVEDGLQAPADGTGNLTLEISYSDVYGHPDGNYDDWIGDRTGLASNISADPSWQPGSYVPAECSPTIDAASPTVDYSLEPPPNGGRANMGHTGGTASAAPSLPDVSGDGMIDGVDLLRISVAFGTMTGDARFNGTVDINVDGFVDGDDLAFLAPRYGESCP